ncbi:MAG: homocysteine S-methyltransferase family protein, partial [Gemmatimonadota bacterium]
MNLLSRLLSRKPVLLLDGAMGTLMMEAGLRSGAPPEEWNDSHPEAVRAIHEAYIKAGSDIILTNSFGGNPFRLRSHGLEESVFRLNTAAAEIAREASDSAGRIATEAEKATHHLRNASSDSDLPVLVGGSVG